MNDRMYTSQEQTIASLREEIVVLRELLAEAREDAAMWKANYQVANESDCEVCDAMREVGAGTYCRDHEFAPTV